MDRLIEKYVDGLIQNNTIEKDNRELYEFGLKQGILMVVNIATTLIIGLIFGMFWQSAAFLVAYIPLRSYAGGAHAKTQFRCYLYSILLTVAALSAIKFIPWSNFIILSTTFVAGAIIYALAPVEDSNKPLDQLEITIYKKRARLLLVCEMCAVLLSLLLGLESLASCISVSILALSGMLVMGKLKCK